jgi:hypothetical protein
MLLNPVRDDLGIPQTMWMMRRAVLDHHRDATAQLLIQILDWQRVALEQRIGAATHIQQRHVVVCQSAELRKRLLPDQGIVCVNARDLIWIVRGPVIFVEAASAHPDESGFG